MPDIHWGYGFPIGGVAATDPDEGVVSPGGVGYDINCGVRLVGSRLSRVDVAPAAARHRQRDVRARADRRRRTSARSQTLAATDLRGVLRGRRDVGGGARLWPPRRARIHRRGRLLAGRGPGASCRIGRWSAARRSSGTLGSGNHFAEVQSSRRFTTKTVARAFGLRRDQITVMIHSGSRGLGHQVCEDHLRVMIKASAKYGIDLPDRQLCCAPLRSPEGTAYLEAMCAAANYAFAIAR